jgi:hypothetical protein
MSELEMVFRKIRTKVEETRSQAAQELAAFAETVAADAREHAPVRKVYRGNVGRKGQKGGMHRSPGHLPSDEMFNLMADQAEKTRFFSKTAKPALFNKEGLMVRPDIKQGWNQGYLNPDVRIHRKRRGASTPMDRRNLVSSRWRVLGTIRKNEFHPRKGTTSSMIVTPALQNKGRAEGTYEPPTISARKDKSGKNDIPMVGKGILRYMNARQRYDVIHNRGVLNVRQTRNGGTQVVLGGTLRDSIQASAVEGLTVTISTDVPYARYMEFGTRYVSAWLFMTTAKMNAEKRMAKSIASGIKG